MSDCLEELNVYVERAFGENAQHLIDSLPYAKLPNLRNLASRESGTYDQIVTQLERKLELSCLENDGEFSMPTMTAVRPNDNHQNNEEPQVVSHNRTKPGHVIRDCRKRIKKK